MVGLKLNNCVHLTENNQITDWVTNSTTSPINVWGMIYPPLLTYTEREVVATQGGNGTLLHYTYCGPFVVLMRAISQYTRTKYKI